MGISFVLAAIVMFIVVVSYLLIRIRRRNVQKQNEAEKVERSKDSANSNYQNRI